MNKEVEFILWVMKEGYKVNTSTGFDFPQDKIWTNKITNVHPILISSNELFRMFKKRDKTEYTTIYATSVKNLVNKIKFLKMYGWHILGGVNAKGFLNPVFSQEMIKIK